MTNFGQTLETFNQSKNVTTMERQAMANTTFSGKKNYDYWKTIFETGKSSDNVY